MVLPLAVMAMIRLIAWLSSVVLVSSYVRDIVTKEPGETVDVSRDATVETILANPDLTPEQKQQTVLEYLNISDDSGFSDIQKYIPLAVVGFIALKIIGGK